MGSPRSIFALHACGPLSAAAKDIPFRSLRDRLRSRPAGALACRSTVTESQSNEVERLLLYISDARARAARALAAVERDGGEEHILEALRESERDLDAVHRRLSQRTFYALPPAELTLGM